MEGRNIDFGMEFLKIQRMERAKQSID